MSQNQEPRGASLFKFDPTVNSGHLMSLAAFLVTGFLAYTNLDKRVTVNEQAIRHSEQRVAEQDQRIKETMTEIKGDIKAVRSTLDVIARQQNTKPNR